MLIIIIILMFIGFVMLFEIYRTNKNNYRHKDRHKDRRKDRDKNKNNIPTENYINKTQKLLSDLNLSNQTLIDIANNYVKNRQDYDAEITLYKEKSLKLLNSVSNNEQSAANILSSILESSAMTNFSHDLSVMSSAVINAQNDVDIANNALDMIKKFVNDKSSSGLRLNEFGDSLSSIQIQQDIANKSYLNIQKRVNNISSIYNLFKKGIEDMLENLNNSRDDFNNLNNFMSNITGNIKQTQDYNKLQIIVNQSNILLKELKNLNVDRENQYYSVIETLIEKLNKSIETSQSFLDNIITIFTYATHDYSSKLYRDLNEIEELNSLNSKYKSNIYEYYTQLLEINSTITNQYNQIITSNNIVSDVINNIHELTREIIKNMDSYVNEFVNTDDLNKLQDILIQYFPASTRPPITIPPLDKLVDFDYTPIPNMTTIPPYNPNPINPPVTEYPVTEYPVSEYPVSEYPVSEYPVSEYPVSEYPVSEYPVSEYPVTEYPVTEGPYIY